MLAAPKMPPEFPALLDPKVLGVVLPPNNNFCCSGPDVAWPPNKPGPEVFGVLWVPVEPNKEVCGWFPPKLNGEEPDPVFGLLPPPNRLPVGLDAKGVFELLFPVASPKLKVGLLSDILPCLVVEVFLQYL